jgi:hypothetical protein
MVSNRDTCWWRQHLNQLSVAQLASDRYVLRHHYILFYNQHLLTLLAGEDGGTTVHQGSCMMSIQAGKGTGLDITALSDKAPDYKGKKCR